MASIPLSFCSTVIDVPRSECEALVNFYNNANGDNWNDVLYEKKYVTLW